MKRAFVLSSAAAGDLDEILEYVLEQSGPGMADRVAKRLYEGFLSLSQHPGMGHTRHDLTRAAAVRELDSCGGGPVNPK